MEAFEIQGKVSGRVFSLVSHSVEVVNEFVRTVERCGSYFGRRWRWRGKALSISRYLCQKDRSLIGKGRKWERAASRGRKSARRASGSSSWQRNWMLECFHSLQVICDITKWALAKRVWILLKLWSLWPAKRWSSQFWGWQILDLS